MLSLIWDLDGTLIDSEEEVLRSVELALQDAGIDPALKKGELRVGPTIDVMLRNSFAPDLLSEEKLIEATRHFRKRYDNSTFELTSAFAGMERILKDGRRFSHYLVTNKPDLATGRIIEKLGWNGLFHAVLTPYSHMVSAQAASHLKKSKVELFREVVELSGEKSESFVGIGDMASDCIAARECGIAAIGVLWGSGTEKELREAGCELIVEDADGLEAALSHVKERFPL